MLNGESGKCNGKRKERMPVRPAQFREPSGKALHFTPQVILIQEFIFLPVESFQAIDDSCTFAGITPHPNSTSNSDRDVQAEIFATHDKIMVLVDKCDHLHTQYGTLENWATWKLNDILGDVLKLSNVF